MNSISNKDGKDNSDQPFDLKEYVEAANDAANRTRYVSIVLVIATILIFVGLNNEYMNSWMVEDLREVYKPGDQYISSLFEYKILSDYESNGVYFRKHCTNLNHPIIDEPVSLTTDINLQCDPPPAEKAKKDAQEALMKIHMESRLFIRIPILGVSIHVNDLGLIGGITLIVLLLLTRTSLSREIKNLNFSFKKAYEAKKLDEFYDALALRQLFTVPHMKGEKRNHFLSKTPYIVCLFPAFIYLWLVTYDVFTVIVIPRYRNPISMYSLPASSILWLMLVEGICVVVICFTALRCAERQHYIYSVWDSYWKLLKPTTNLCLLDSAVVDRLKKDPKGYSVVVEDGVAKAVLDEEIITELKTAKMQAVQEYNLYLFRWIWRAIKEETIPSTNFISHVLQLLNRKYTAEKPLLITIDAELTEMFSNDKEVNEKLKEILMRREKENQGEQSSTISNDGKTTIKDGDNEPKL